MCSGNLTSIHLDEYQLSSNIGGVDVLWSDRMGAQKGRINCIWPGPAHVVACLPIPTIEHPKLIAGLTACFQLQLALVVVLQPS